MAPRPWIVPVKVEHMTKKKTLFQHKFIICSYSGWEAENLQDQKPNKNPTQHSKPHTSPASICTSLMMKTGTILSFPTANHKLTNQDFFNNFKAGAICKYIHKHTHTHTHTHCDSVETVYALRSTVATK